ALSLPRLDLYLRRPRGEPWHAETPGLRHRVRCGRRVWRDLGEVETLHPRVPTHRRRRLPAYLHAAPPGPGTPRTCFGYFLRDRAYAGHARGLRLRPCPLV